MKRTALLKKISCSHSLTGGVASQINCSALQPQSSFLLLITPFHTYSCYRCMVKVAQLVKIINITLRGNLHHILVYCFLNKSILPPEIIPLSRSKIYSSSLVQDDSIGITTDRRAKKKKKVVAYNKRVRLSVA